MAKVSECHRCYARKTIGRHYPVDGTGNINAKLMFVKDRPNMAALEMGELYDEIEKKILEKLLKSAYIHIDNVYMTTVTKCPSKLDAEAVTACKPFLWQEIQNIQPTVIMTLGLFSTLLLLKRKNLGYKFKDVVGQIFELDYMDSYLIPNFQPMWLMQNKKVYRDAAVIAILKASNIMNRSVGKIGEQFCRKILEGAGIECEFNTDRERLIEFDILCKMGRKKFTVEVKYDRMSSSTGNLAIETANVKKNEPSGVYGSTADIFVYVLNDGLNMVAFAINRKKLIDYIESVQPKRIVECGGDDNARLLLYPDLKILKEFTQIDNLKATQLKKTITKILNY